MRFSSSLSSSIPSYLNGEDIPFQTSLYHDSSSHFASPESISSDDSKILHLDTFWNLQQRDCMLGSENEWMQPFGYSLPFQPSDECVDSTNDHGDPSQFYGESAYAPTFPSGFPQQFPQQSVGSHRRIQSSSSAASAADSPYSHNASIPVQQYPTTYTQPAGFATPQASGWTWDSLSPISGAQHLPTPTGTPTPDQYAQRVQAQGQNPRRTKQSTPNLHAARVRAHHVLRDSLNQQWKPNTYIQSHLQVQVQNFYADMPRTPQTVHSDDVEAQQYGAGKIISDIGVKLCNDDLLIDGICSGDNGAKIGSNGFRRSGRRTVQHVWGPLNHGTSTPKPNLFTTPATSPSRTPTCGKQSTIIISFVTIRACVSISKITLRKFHRLQRPKYFASSHRDAQLRPH